MKGFRERADLAEVQSWVDAQPVPVATRSLCTEELAGRVLATPVVSPVAIPPFPRAAMDGWAVRGEDTFGATEGEPLTLSVVGLSLPGAPAERPVDPGTAVRIMTGAPVPDGADAVLRAEDGHESDGELRATAAVAPGRNVGQVGEDVQPGDVVIPAGRPLRPQDGGMASALGQTHLDVLRGPVVEILITGDEVVPPDTAPDPHQICDANGVTLRALVMRDGGQVPMVVYLADDADDIATVLADGDEETPVDVLIVTGGSSVGQEDHAPRLLAEHGEMAYHGVGLRPAAPTGMGRIGDKLVFLLPGNPVACLCAYDLIVSRYVRRAAGLSPELPYREIEGVLARKVASVLGRVDYVRVHIDGDRLTPVMSTGASILSSTTTTDGFLLVPKDLEGYPEGARVSAFRYDPACVTGFVS